MNYQLFKKLLIRERNFRDIDTLDNGVIKVSRLGSIYYILPLERFPTANNDNVIIICKDVWNKEKRTYLPKEFCHAGYTHFMGLTVQYWIKKHNIEDNIIEAEEELRRFLDGLSF